MMYNVVKNWGQEGKSIFPYPESCTFHSTSAHFLPRVPRLLNRLDGDNARIRQLVPIDDHLATTTKEGVRFTLELDASGQQTLTKDRTGNDLQHSSTILFVDGNIAAI